ncbi:MAG: folylpolyglutamate synthase/dihydrofolate synthase family protein [Planctomycetota bacterium]|nr:folylpolyglutamate synthase/dihydrofolate synthase family protein [Planctomycetota bacterium]
MKPSRSNSSSRRAPIRVEGREASRAQEGQPDASSASTTPRRPTKAVKLEPDSIRDYASALAYLANRLDVERLRPASIPSSAFYLERMRGLMSAMGNPHEATRFAHVAGSKGKGSTCEMLAASLQSCGYTVGLYTSPHVVDVRERIRLNSEMIRPEDFAASVAEAARAGATLSPELGDVTYFELVTAAALAYFAREAVDIAVLEVGLGGRLDATNVITPDVSAITAIQLEHTQILGDTLAKIAREKAGIMKSGVVTYTIPQAPEVIENFRAVASEVEATLRVLQDDVDFTWRFEHSPELGSHARIGLTTRTTTFEHVPVPLPGQHQAFNCGVVLAMLDTLRDRGFDRIAERKVVAGLARTPRNARLEFVSQRPRIIVDGAHNPESIEALIQTIGAFVRADTTVFIFGCAADKDVKGMLVRLARGSDKVIFTKAADSPRSIDPRELYRRYVEISPKMAQVAPDIGHALEMARQAVGREDVICVTGSFYLAGDAKRYLASRSVRSDDSRAG